MLTSSMLAVSLLFAGQAVAQYPADQTMRGCGYSAEAGALTEVRWGVFLNTEPPFADSNGFSVQVDGQWVHPDKSPYPKGEGRVWFDKGEQITFKDRVFAKDGAPLVYGIDEVQLTGEHDGLPVAVGSPLSPQAPGAILILVDPGSCGWQRYLPA